MADDLKALRDDVTMLTKMVASLMKDQSTKGQNRYHVIGGFVYGQTGNNDPFVILYPIQEYLTEKICRVYPHDFKKLPSFIDTKDVPGDTDENPDKGKAMKRGIYHECPAFGIATFPGKMTQMGPEVRFSDVLWVSRKGQTYQQETQEEGQEEAPATPQPIAPTNGKTPLPPVADDNRAALAILKEIGQLGAQAYGAEPWRDGVAGDVAVWGSSGRVGSVDDLNPEEAVTVRDALRRRVSKLAADLQS